MRVPPGAVPRWITTAAAVALAWSFGRVAEGQSPDDEQRYSVWQSDKHTLFVASASDVGVIYGRPHVTLGYGAPFWHFVGVDAFAIATNEFAAAYVGWRANLPFLDVQMGYRATQPYDRRELPVKDSYVADDLPRRDGDENATYGAVEFEVTPLAPVPGGVAFAELHPIWVTAPRDTRLFEEVTRTVYVAPFLMRARLGYIYDLDRVKAGAMVEHVVLPGRPKDVTRVGPLVLVSLAERLEGLFTTTVVVRSPDSLGFSGVYGFLGLRMRFAQRF